MYLIAEAAPLPAIMEMNTYCSNTGSCEYLICVMIEGHEEHMLCVIFCLAGGTLFPAYLMVTLVGEWDPNTFLQQIISCL